MRGLEALVLRAAGTDDPILIQGEAGTGKTLVAKATHDLSGRSGKPFRRVRCISLPAKLLEAEIFGPGGKLGLAAEGTLLLELPTGLQSRVARALNDGRSSSVEWPVRLAANVRVLATTTRPLSALSALSEDLHHLVVRERREEIPSLVEHFRNGFGWVKDRPTQGVGLREIGRRAAQAAEQTALRDALARVGGHRAAAARLLQVSYRTLLQKLSADEHGSRSGARSRTAAGDAGPQPGDGALA
jgi:DNA-binding NtrC family response regulator